MKIMREEEIKKKAEEYESKYNYSLAIARHFEEGAKWALSQPQIVEIFGKRVKIVEDRKSVSCKICAFDDECEHIEKGCLCQTSNLRCLQHFVEVDEDGNEIGGDK